MKKIFIITFILVAGAFNIHLKAQDIMLPAPDRTGGKPLMMALNERQSIRSFTRDALTNQQLSDLLWACWGFNRSDAKKRTAPSSRNVQEMEVYVSMASGAYIYDAEKHILKQIHNRDIRSLCGSQDFVATAALNLIFVSDLGKLGKKETDIINPADLLSSYANTGFMAQNVYLYCASAGLGCVVRGMVPAEKLGPEMKLRPNQVIILGQTVGVLQR